MGLSFLEKLKRESGIEPSKEKSPKKTSKKKLSVKPVKPLKPIKPAKPEEGQLAVDVYQTDSEIIIITPIARVKAEDLDIFIEDDTVIIKGKREAPEEEEKAREFLYQECHWGKFSRQIVLPEEVDSSRVVASLKGGVLILKLPKVQVRKKRKIAVKQIESE